MTDDGPGPNIRRRQLGRELRRLREAAGLTLKEIADKTGLTTTTISRIEGGKQTILSRNVRLLCQGYDVGAPLIDTLLRLAEESNEDGWWAAFSDNLPDWFESFVGLESDAEELWNYSPSVIDGLLQTSEYAEAFFELGPDSTGCDLQRSIDLRQARQNRLHRDTSPTKLHAVLDEAAVRRVVGGTRVMREQLHYLVEAANRPNITVQILPFAAGAQPGLLGPFSMLKFPEGFNDMDVVYLENQRGAIWQERISDIAHYSTVFSQLCDAALSPDDSAKLVDSLASSL